MDQRTAGSALGKYGVDSYVDRCQRKAQDARLFCSAYHIMSKI